MATRKKKKTTNFVQFSKRLVAAVMIFWGVIRLVSVVAALVNPDSAEHMAEIVAGIDEIAMINCLAYTGNSVSEKIALGYFDMRKSEKDDADDEEDEETNS